MKDDEITFDRLGITWCGHAVNNHYYSIFGNIPIDKNYSVPVKVFNYKDTWYCESSILPAGWFKLDVDDKYLAVDASIQLIEDHVRKLYEVILKPCN